MVPLSGLVALVSRPSTVPKRAQPAALVDADQVAQQVAGIGGGEIAGFGHLAEAAEPVGSRGAADAGFVSHRLLVGAINRGGAAAAVGVVIRPGPGTKRGDLRSGGVTSVRPHIGILLELSRWAPNNTLHGAAVTVYVLPVFDRSARSKGQKVVLNPEA